MFNVTMENDIEKKQELQSRRDFFKKATLKTLPILGCLLASQIPLQVKAEPSMWCMYGSCMGTCFRTCLGSCQGCRFSCMDQCINECVDSCRGGCNDACAKGCHIYCKGTCKGTCYAFCRNAEESDE